MTDFIDKCVTEIQESPESMRAGMSSVLLKTIATTSVSLQDAVGKQVYLNIVDQVNDPDVNLVN